MKIIRAFWFVYLSTTGPLIGDKKKNVLIHRILRNRDKIKPAII